MSMFYLYLLVKLDSLKDILMFLGIAPLVVAGVIIFFAVLMMVDVHISDDTFVSILKKSGYIVLPICTTLVIISNLLPSTKEMAFIYIASKITQSDAMKKVEDIPSKAIDILNIKMNEYIKDITKEAEAAEKIKKESK